MLRRKPLMLSFVLVVGLASCWGCSLPFLNPENIQPTDILANFIAPATAKKGTAVSIRVFLMAGDGCTSPAWVVADLDQAQKLVTLRGATKTKPGALCTQLVWYPDAQASFVPHEAGTYTVRAKIAPGLSAESHSGGYAHLQPKI
jgi:hypothetical protein